MYHVNYIETPKDDGNKKTAKIEITIKPQLLIPHSCY